MTQETSQKNVFRIYRETELSITAQRGVVTTLEARLSTWIRKSGPSVVRAQSYDGDNRGGTIYMPDEEVLENIAVISNKLAIEKENLEIMEASFLDLKRVIRKTSKELESDLQLKVFVASWIDGKRIAEMAQEFGYSTVYIKKAKGKIYEKMLSNMVS